MSENETLKAIIEKHASELAEHFDSVRVFCTKHPEGSSSETVTFEEGRGNFYAQLGQIVEWMSIQDQFQRNYAIKKDKEL
jgi:hypothetical protein